MNAKPAVLAPPGTFRPIPARYASDPTRYGATVDGAGDVGAQPGALRRAALRAYAALPRWARLEVVRLVAPSHTVGAICFLEHVADGTSRVLLLRQRHRHGWTLPGGLVDRGESAQDAVRREVYEETGLRISVDAPLTTVVDPAARRVDVIFHVPVDRPPDVVARSEAVEAVWLEPSEAGQVDEPTAQAFAAFTVARRPGSAQGRLLGPT